MRDQNAIWPRGCADSHSSVYLCVHVHAYDDVHVCGNVFVYAYVHAYVNAYVFMHMNIKQPKDNTAARRYYSNV